MYRFTSNLCECVCKFVFIVNFDNATEPKTSKQRNTKHCPQGQTFPRPTVCHIQIYIQRVAPVCNAYVFLCVCVHCAYVFVCVQFMHLVCSICDRTCSNDGAYVRYIILCGFQWVVNMKGVMNGCVGVG